jgi:NosR/NirI family transcriptional regulator, nitrous oxide reductase regulator
MDSESQTFPLPVVRDRPLQPRAKRPIRAILFHVLRLAIFVSVLLLIRLQHQRFVAEEAARDQQPVDVKVLREFFPDAVDGGLFDPARRTQQIVNAANQPLGFVVQTSPQSDNIVGFSGPTNLLIAFGTDERILSLTILWSRDTREHVALIERQTDFLKTWNGSLWSDAANLKSIDAVSGATLTSLAIAESIATRLGGSVPSLRFPDEIDVAEVATWFPAAAAFSADPRRPSLLHALAKDGTQLG